AGGGGLDVVGITDQTVTSAGVRAGTLGGLGGARVIVGEEVRTQAGEVIGLFLAERIPYVLPAAEAIGRIRAQGGLVYLPHPYDPVRGSLGAEADRLFADRSAAIVGAVHAKHPARPMHAKAR